MQTWGGANWMRTISTPTYSSLPTLLPMMDCHGWIVIYIVSIPALHFNKLKKISGTEGDKGNNNGVYCMETDHADTLVQVVPQVTTNSSQHNKPKKAHIRQVVPQGTNFSIILYCLFFHQNKYFY